MLVYIISKITVGVTGEDDPTQVARRHRHSPWPLKTVEEAINIILDHSSPGQVETVSYRKARGRHIAQNVSAPEPLPPFPASIKDGYAVIGMNSLFLV